MTEYAYSRKLVRISSETSTSRMRSSKSSGSVVLVRRAMRSRRAPSQRLRYGVPLLGGRPHSHLTAPTISAATRPHLGARPHSHLTAPTVPAATRPHLGEIPHPHARLR